MAEAAPVRAWRPLGYGLGAGKGRAALSLVRLQSPRSRPGSERESAPRRPRSRSRVLRRSAGGTPSPTQRYCRWGHRARAQTAGIRACRRGAGLGGSDTRWGEADTLPRPGRRTADTPRAFYRRLGSWPVTDAAAAAAARPSRRPPPRRNAHPATRLSAPPPLPRPRDSWRAAAEDGVVPVASPASVSL